MIDLHKLLAGIPIQEASRAEVKLLCAIAERIESVGKTLDAMLERMPEPPKRKHKTVWREGYPYGCSLHPDHDGECR